MLRLNLSHKWNHNFVDMVFDACSCSHGIESTKHFLLEWPLFINGRQCLIRTVNEIMNRTNLHNIREQYLLYLYGNYLLDDSDNKIILLATIKYIKDTKRFSWTKSVRCTSSILWAHHLILFFVNCIVLFFNFFHFVICKCCKFLGLPWCWTIFCFKPRQCFLSWKDKT